MIDMQVNKFEAMWDRIAKVYKCPIVQNNFEMPFYYHMCKYAVAVPAIPYLAHNLANIIKSIFGKNKKGFVLDLDNTLWGGIIGDDGVDNIVLGSEESEGQAYSEFQRYIRQHKQLGIILNVDSKNEYDNASDFIYEKF